MSDKLLDHAVKHAFAPPPPQQLPQPQQGVPVQMVLQMVSTGVLTPQQAWYWIFKQIEPTEFNGYVTPTDRDEPRMTLGEAAQR